MNLNLRALDTADRPQLRFATAANMNWQGVERFTFKDVDQAPELRHYFDLTPARGDFGYIAENDGLVIGAVWLLFFTMEDKGFGFVAEGVPELSISVWPGYTGQGVGEQLMRRAIEEAAARNIAQVSLSVEEGNPAVELYRRWGFVPAEDAAAGTLVWNL